MTDKNQAAIEQLIAYNDWLEGAREFMPQLSLNTICSSIDSLRKVAAIEAQLTEAMELLHQTRFDDGAISAAEWEQRYKVLLISRSEASK